MFIGNVTSGILHHEIDATIYLPPAVETSSLQCPPKNYLVAIDGSNNSFAALDRAQVLASISGERFEKIVVATVLDVAECSKTLAGGMKPKSFDSAMLEKAVDQLISAGIAKEQIVESITCGDPAAVLSDLVHQHNIDVVFMGRRGRGAIRELFMGSVSSRIIQRCMAQTIVLVNAE